MDTRLNYQISDERALTVYNDIVNGSEPEARFYAMVAASTAIATFGLIQDSAAVVIGAMLVAPLMTPIFGIALGLVRGDAHLLGLALKAEVIGIIVAIAFASLLGFLVPGIEVTDEMLGRTKPNLIDLLIAIFAGFAGAFALVDEKISPALPGVAIATAIVPPLANVGICIALGAYQGAIGSFLLFFANFLSILLISSLLFLYSGMSRDFPSITTKAFLKRFGLACVGFVIITGLFSKGLYNVTKERQLTNNISAILVEELSNLPATDIRQIIHHRKDDKMYIMAHLHSPSEIIPLRVKKIQEVLKEELSTPVELFIRTTLSKDISSTGQLNFVKLEDLDGFYLSRKTNKRVAIIRLSEQIIREYLQSNLGLYLEEVNLIEIRGKSYILATVFGARNLTNDEILKLETMIQQQGNNDSIDLMVRSVEVDLYDKWGQNYLEFAQFEDRQSENDPIHINMENEIRETLSNSNYIHTNTDISFRKGKYHILVELAGTQFYSKTEHTTLQKTLSEISDSPVELYVRSIPEIVVTSDGNISFDMLKERLQRQIREQYQGQIDKITEESL